jgi:hypothetical protein
MLDTWTGLLREIGHTQNTFQVDGNTLYAASRDGLHPNATQNKQHAGSLDASKRCMGYSCMRDVEELLAADTCKAPGWPSEDCHSSAAGRGRGQLDGDPFASERGGWVCIIGQLQ